MHQVKLKTSVLFAAALMVTQSLSQAQLLNGSFESGAPGPGAPSWSTFNDALTSVEYAYNGSANSFKVFGPSQQFAGSGGLQVIPATAGLTYTLAGFAFSPANDFITGNNFATLKLEFLNAASNVIGSTESVFNRNKPADIWNVLSSSAVAPTNTTQARAIIVHVMMNSPATPGAVFFDDVSLTSSVIQPNPTWVTNANGDYFVATNWAAGGAPNGINATANFGSAITAARTINAGGPVTLGTLNFNNANKYTLAGAGSVAMSSSTGDAAINSCQFDESGFDTVFQFVHFVGHRPCQPKHNHQHHEHG